MISPAPDSNETAAIVAVHAAPWRRALAAFYDALLLLALWLTGTLLMSVGQDLLGGHGGTVVQQVERIYCLVSGLLFFGGFWIHGGQTPGMKAWRLRLQREDGSRLRWPVAAARYALLLLLWAAVLIAVSSLVPALRLHFPGLDAWGGVCAVAVAIVAVWTRVDPRRRAPHDRLASTVVLQLPKS